MCFWVDCSETGHTKNTQYIRSELRHLENWSISGNKKLTATIHVQSKANPDKVTVMQIHGITDSNENAPPLLRIALNNGDLYAFLKTNNYGNKTESVLLYKGINEQKFTCSITVKDKHIIIGVNGKEKLNRDFSFWEYKNYFKAGCYPQSHSGTVTVMFDDLKEE